MSNPPSRHAATGRIVAEAIVGALVLLGLWEVIVDHLYSAQGALPAPSQIVRQFFIVDGPAFYAESAGHTLRAAVQGFAWGAGLALAVAMLTVVWPVAEMPLLLLGAVSYCLPIVAIGPILSITTSGDTPRVILAAMSVFFGMLIGARLGLRSPTPAMLDVIRGFGGGDWTALVRVRLRAALPQVFASLRVAAPAAVLGSIVGEFLGAENGLGVVLINSQQAMNTPRTWTVAVVAGALAGAAYAIVSLAGHGLTPWARETHSNLAAASSELTSTVGRWRLILRTIFSAALAITIVAAVWFALLRLFHVSPFLGKSPADVWAYVTDPDTGAGTRHDLLVECGTTLRDAGLGLAAGTLAALAAAAVFQLTPIFRRLFLAPALALQSVPLVALTPLIVLIFGRNVGAIAVIGGILTFFPTLVNVTLALGRTPRDATDLVRVYGGSRLTALRLVQAPHALPALFASLRIAAPLSITGALLAEWLATGEGLGYALMSDVSTSDYSALWTRVAVATLLSLVLYNLIGLAERLAQPR